MQYTISGKVIRGDGYGRKIGFPTVNLQTNDKPLPEAGVYAGLGILEGKEYKAGIVIGPNDKIEAHFIDYTGDAYGKEVVLKLKNFFSK